MSLPHAWSLGPIIRSDNFLLENTDCPWYCLTSGENHIALNVDSTLKLHSSYFCFLESLSLSLYSTPPEHISVGSNWRLLFMLFLKKPFKRVRHRAVKHKLHTALAPWIRHLFSKHMIWINNQAISYVLHDSIYGRIRQYTSYIFRSGWSAEEVWVNTWLCIHSCQFIFANPTCKLRRITAEYTFRACHTNHIIM